MCEVHGSKMNFCTIVFNALIIGAIFTNALYLDSDKQQQINEIVEALMGCSNMMGIQVAVVKNGETVFTQGYGLLDIERNDNVTPKTLFNIGSVTKHFTSALLGMVLEENGLSWDTKVREIIGEDFYFNDGLRTSQATLKDLVSHRMGLPRRDSTPFRDATAHDVALLHRFVTPTHGFRDSVQYNNQMYELLGHITEVVSGNNWEDLMTERIFKPANMSSSTFIQKVDLSRDDLARPYFMESEDGPLIRVNDSLNARYCCFGGAGSIVTNAEDMTNWMKLQVDEGRLNGVQVISENVVSDTHTAFNLRTLGTDVFSKPIVPETFVLTGYGAGLNVGSYRGFSMVYHSGSLYGYNAWITMLPDMDIGIFTVLNGLDLSSARQLLHIFIMDVMLGEEPWLNTTTICTFPEPWVSKQQGGDPIQMMQYQEDGVHARLFSRREALPTKPYPSDLMPYLGVYGDFYYGNITVFSDDSQTLFMKLGTFDPWRLVPAENENEFAGIPTQAVWPLELPYAKFSSSGEGQPQFDLCEAALDSDGLTRFTRDLKMSDAPLPPNPNECD